MPRAGKRRTVARGIYADPFGFEIRWRDRGHARQKRFPLDTPLDRLREFRKSQLQRATQQTALRRDGSFPRDAVRFLKGRRRLPSFKSDRSHLRPWVHRFRRLSRWTVTHDHVTRALEEWAALGYSTGTLRHRLRVLTALYHALDAGVAQIPTFGVKVPKGRAVLPQRRPPDDLIADTARQLRLQELTGKLRDAKTRARFLVLAMTGMRPAQLMRALPALDIALDDRLWVVQAAKGDKGTVIYLNEDMLHATHLFIAADAAGAYSTSSFAKTLHRNGWPKDMRPYNVRHAVGQRLKRSGAELGDIADHLGHRSLETARRFYTEPDLARLRATSERLDGRLSLDLFTLTQPTTTNTGSEKAKGRENRRKLDTADRRVATPGDSPITTRSA